MRVELRVLSGSRRNESVELEGERFVVGGDPQGDLFFDPADEPAVRGVRAQIRREEDGWRIRRFSGEGMLVNHKWLDVELPIRSGDVVRLTPTGPDFRFSLVAARENGHAHNHSPVAEEAEAAVQAAAPAAETAAAKPAAAWPGVWQPDAAEEKRQPAPAEPAKPAIVATRPDTWVGRPQWLAGVVVLALAIVVVVMLLRPYLDRLTGKPAAPKQPAAPVAHTGKQGTEPKAVVPADKAVTGDPAVPAKPGETAVAVAPKSGDAGAAAETPSGPAVAPPVAPPEKGAKDTTAAGAQPAAKPEQAAPAVPTGPPTPLAILVIESKEKKQLQPFALACAVEQEGRQMLLTTGRIGLIMAQYDRPYFAIVPGGAGEEPAVIEINPDGIHMHLLYVTSLEQENRTGAEFFDVAVLTFRGKLPANTACAVAAREALNRIRPGAALECWTAPKPRDLPSGQAPARDDVSGVKKQPAELAAAPRLEETDDAQGDVRRLFELTGLKDEFLEGSPVLNQQGRVVAVCTQRANADKAGLGKAVRAALIDAEMLTALWTGRPAKQWFVPERKPRPEK